MVFSTSGAGSETAGAGAMGMARAAGLTASAAPIASTAIDASFVMSVKSCISSKIVNSETTLAHST